MDPFKYGQVVSGEYFCPRPDLAKTLKEHIEAGQNVYVQGERRIGKTSLITDVAKGLKSHQLLYVDLLGIKSVDLLVKKIALSLAGSSDKKGNFLERIMKHLAHLGFAFSLDPITYAPSITVAPGVRSSGPDSIEAALSLIGTVHTSAHPVLVVFDEFQAILGIKDKEEIIARMRGIIQFQPDIPYVFAGSVRSAMDELFISPDSPFFKSAIQIFVGPLDEKEFRGYLVERFQKGAREITDTALDEIFKICDGVSGDAQQLCSALWSITDEDAIITEKTIPDALTVVFGRELAGYEAAVESLSEQQMKCLVGVAKYGGKEVTGLEFLNYTGLPLPSSSKKAVERLVSLRILFRQKGEYRFTNPFFKEWLQRREF